MDVFDEESDPFDLKKPKAKSADTPEDDYDDYDELDDASPDDIDFVIEIHREDGALAGSVLHDDLANDFDELINQLSRVPGDAGAVGFVSIAGEFFVICRVRGQFVQVLLSDNGAANDWPLARDVVDYLGEDVPDPDDDSMPIGDLDLFADSGLAAFDLEQLASDYDLDSDEVVAQIAAKLMMTSQFERLIEAYDSQ